MTGRGAPPTEIDFMSTYVGGTRACVEAIVSHPDLEAAVVASTDGITWASDRLNPPPPIGEA